MTERHADSYTVELGAPFTGTLPALGFEGATRRNRPTLAPGDLVYARVAAASRDAGPELACTDASGKARAPARSLSAMATRALRNAQGRAGLHGAPRSRRASRSFVTISESIAEGPAMRMQAAGFGPLQEGVVVTCSSALVRQLLASPAPPVRRRLGRVLRRPATCCACCTSLNTRCAASAEARMSGWRSRMSEARVLVVRAAALPTLACKRAGVRARCWRRWAAR